jgi:heat shock protein HslJ
MRSLIYNTIKGEVFMLFVLCSMFACSDKSSDSGMEEEVPFAGMDFLLESSEGYSFVSSDVRIFFRDDSELSISAGCNGMSGSYSVEEDVFSISVLSTTEMACADDLMADDGWMYGFITSSPTFAFDGTRLTFNNPDATLVFLDSEIATPDQSLSGVTWMVDSFIEGEFATAYNLNEMPTLEFSDDGTVTFFSGCNSGSGSYVAEGGTLSFSDLSSTEMACGDSETTVEQHIVSVMSERELSYEIDASRLTISGASLGISAYTEE